MQLSLSGKELAASYDVPFLGEVPIKEQIREGGDLGKPVSSQDDAATEAIFDIIAENVARNIAINNAKPKAQIVENEN